MEAARLSHRIASSSRPSLRTQVGQDPDAGGEAGAEILHRLLSPPSSTKSSQTESY